MRIWIFVLASLVELLQLLQKDRHIKFAIVAIAESLYSLVNCILVIVVEKVRDFACPVHSLEGDFDRFRFVG